MIYSLIKRSIVVYSDCFLRIYREQINRGRERERERERKRDREKYSKIYMAVPSLGPVGMCAAMHPCARCLAECTRRRRSAAVT